MKTTIGSATVGERLRPPHDFAGKMTKIELAHYPKAGAFLTITTSYADEYGMPACRDEQVYVTGVALAALKRLLNQETE